MRKLIWGTDWWTDCDDAVALRLLARAHLAGEIELLGVGINACMEYSVSSLKGFLLAEGVENIPLGIDRAATNFGTWGGEFLYQRHLTEAFCLDGSNADAEDAVRLYRRLLAERAEKVEIVEIGYLQAIAAVLASGADDRSPLSGVELFRQKVSKVWVMAGYEKVTGYAAVDVDTGANHFRVDPAGLHAFVVKMREDVFYKNEINRRID